jgi:hypothetical protein
MSVVEYYVLIYENGKMRPVETIPGVGGEREIKEKDGEGEFNYDNCKNFCKCHNVPPVPQ